MSKIEEIAREYADEYFTNEMLLSGDENRKETETSVFEGMTKSELLAKINKLLKSMDFLEAKRLLDVYKSLK